MKRPTALKILGWGYLVMLLLTVLSRGPVREMLGAGVMIGFFLAVAWLRDRPRQNAAELEARRLGLRFSAKDDAALLDEPFALFRRTRRRYGELTNVLWGPWHGLEVRVFDYEYMISENNWRHLSCAVAAIPGGWPALVIQPETLVTTVADHLALPDIEFELEQFNRMFEVRCEDRKFAGALVDARMIEWLMGRSPLPGFEINGRWILAYRNQVQPWELDAVLGLLESFVERIPRVVRSVYPEALPPRPDTLV
jgi:hypothetical protein